MFSISDKDIAAIQAAFERGGELSATIEVRRIFPGIPDNAEARRIALIIAGWEPVSPGPIRNASALQPGRPGQIR